MQMKNWVVGTLLMGMAAAVNADYMTELTLTPGVSKDKVTWEEFSGDEKFEATKGKFAIEATQYLSPVKTDKGPWSEAAFLSKASAVGLSWKRDKVTYEFGSVSPDVKGTDRGQALNGKMVIPNGDIILTGKYGREKTDFDSDGQGYDADTLSLGAGKYLTDQASIEVTYQQMKFDYNDPDDDSNTNDLLSVQYKQIIDLSGQQWIVVKPSALSFNGDDGKGAVLGADVSWFPVRWFGFTAGASVESSEYDDGEEDDTKGESRLGADYFIDQNLKVTVLWTNSRSETDSDDGFESETRGREFIANVTARF